MNTPVTKSKLRIGLSRTSSASKNQSSVSTPSSTTKSYSSLASSTTPNVSSKTPLKKTVIKKKKLEFAAKQLEPEPAKEDIVQDVDLESLDIDALKKHVEQKKNLLKSLEKHQAEKEELTNLTEQWKQAGLDAMDHLRKFVEPPMANEEILDCFKIPHTIFL